MKALSPQTMMQPQMDMQQRLLMSILDPGQKQSKMSGIMDTVMSDILTQNQTDKASTVNAKMEEILELQSTEDTYKKVQKALGDLQRTINVLGNSESYKKVESIVSTNEAGRDPHSFIEVITEPGARVENYKVTVESEYQPGEFLLCADTVNLKGFEGEDKQLISGEFIITIDNGQEGNIDIKIKNETTVAACVEMINGGNCGVTAEVIQIQQGIAIKIRDPEDKIKKIDGYTYENNDATQLPLKVICNNNYLKAEILVNGYKSENGKSNVVTNPLDPKVKFKVHNANSEIKPAVELVEPAEPEPAAQKPKVLRNFQKVSIIQDTEYSKGMLDNFIDAYNAVVSLLQEQIENLSEKEDLSKKMEFNQLLNQVESLLSSSIYCGSIFDLGVDLVNEDGSKYNPLANLRNNKRDFLKLEITDSESLEAKLAANPNIARDLFNSTIITNHGDLRIAALPNRVRLNEFQLSYVTAGQKIALFNNTGEPIMDNTENAITATYTAFIGGTQEGGTIKFGDNPYLPNLELKYYGDISNFSQDGNISVTLSGLANEFSRKIKNIENTISLQTDAIKPSIKYKEQELETAEKNQKADNEKQQQEMMSLIMIIQESQMQMQHLQTLVRGLNKD